MSFFNDSLRKKRGSGAVDFELLMVEYIVETGRAKVGEAFRLSSTRPEEG